MAIPTFEQMMRPILALAAEHDISRRTIIEPIATHFDLSKTEREAQIPSGAGVVANRTGWAMTFLTKAGLIAKVSRGQYRITDAGRQFLAEHPTELLVKHLKALPGWEAAWNSKKQGSSASQVDDESTSDAEATPTEVLESALGTLRKDLASRLIDEILGQSPTFFEHLVLDVLVAMGYGGSRASAAAHLGKSNDEGIDGRINQDPLGLDQIMVQAKRYARENAIDRKTIQAFIGSLAGQGVTKGIFITTSYFAQSAEEFVQRGSNTKVVLVDGEELIDLMMRYHIGVRVERSIELLELDQNYFEDE
jgi:restriction system protein